MKELNDGLTPLVNAETADNRQPSTAYSEGDIKYSPLLPTGWFLACTVSGTTSASELVVPSPVAEGDEITDGGVTWKVKKIGGAGDAGDGVPLGAILPLAHNSTLPSGYLLCDGSAVSRTMFPDLFSLIGTTYGAGDGSTTFNVPDYNAAERFVQGDTVAGTVKQAGLPNITGSVDYLRDALNAHEQASSSSALYWNALDGANGNQGASGKTSVGLRVDASRSNAIYGNSDTVQPNALTARYIIKAFDGQTAASALIDVTQYANELAGKANRALDNLTQAGQDSFLERDFTIIYPNGGTEANPANVTNNSRYVESNPFHGYYVYCEAEIYVNDNWAWGGWYTTYVSGDKGTFVAAKQFNDNIIIQTGNYYIAAWPSIAGTPNNNITQNIATAPCRVKVWKIGKIPD